MPLPCFSLLKIAILLESCPKPFTLKVDTFNGVHNLVELVIQACFVDNKKRYRKRRKYSQYT